MPWTDRTLQRARQKFLDGLGKGLSVTGSANLAGLARSTVYEWRQSEASFAAEWDASIESGTDILEDEARRRALEGTQEPVIAMGRVARADDGTTLMVRKYSDTLMCLLLKGRRREKFSERVQQDIKLDAKIETDGQQARDIVSERLAQLSERVAKADDDKPTLQ
jgi:hypothetical protein